MILQSQYYFLTIIHLFPLLPLSPTQLYLPFSQNVKPNLPLLSQPFLSNPSQFFYRPFPPIPHIPLSLISRFSLPPLSTNFLHSSLIILIVVRLSMPERKGWTAEEDLILKLLKEQRGEKKWSIIAKLMHTEFAIIGRTGKQCRERYHNHLDSSIVAEQWTKREEDILFQNHEMIGNKWSIIAQKLTGRSDNCVKNHFYSKLRKAIRRLNRVISDRFKTQFHEIKISLLYRIIQTTQQKFKLNSKVDQDLVQLSNDIKNKLYKLQYSYYGNGEESQKMVKLIQTIHEFEGRLRKNSRGSKKHKISIETVESRAELPQVYASQQNVLKEEDDELSYYRIIKKICQEIVVSKDQ